MLKTDVALQLRATHHKMIQLMKAKISEYDLTFGLLNILVRIEKNPNTNQKQLAEDMNFTQGAMSIAVKRLIENDMIKQVPLESDMRYNRLNLTKKGKAMIASCKDHMTERYENIFYGFDDGELNQLYYFLKKINNNLDKINKEDCL